MPPTIIKIAVKFELEIRVKNLVIVCFLSVFCLFSAVANSKPSSLEIEKLERGEIIIKSIPQQGDGTRFQAWAIFHASVNDTRDVLIDFKSYPQFMPDITNTEILSKEPTIVNYTLGLPMGMKKRYRLSHTVESHDEEVKLRWKQIPWKEVAPEDSIRDTKGLWHLSALAENKTLVLYDITTDPGDVPFGFGWIVDYLSKESVPNVLKNTKAYISDKSFRK